MRYLGIDFGEKRVGIAVSDDMGKIAFPYSVVLNDQRLVEEIEKIVKNERIGAIVMGESKNFAGEPNKIMAAIDKFKKELGEKTKLEVFLEPEFMTSVQAEKVHGKNEMHDASAASIILQSYLDRHIRSNE